MPLPFQRRFFSSPALATTGVTPVTAATDNWSVYFDGTDDYITTPFDLGTEVGAGDVSISTWVKFADLSADQFFLYFGTSDIATAYVTLKYDLSDNEIQSVTRRVAGGSVLARYDMTGKTTSDWLHIVYTRTGTTTNLYANGTLADSQSGIQGDSAFGDTTFFGALSGAITGNCRLSQVSVWSSLLSATEITALYNSGTPVDPTANGGDYTSSSNLVGYWDMENTGTTTVTDGSTNSNDGTLTNGAAFDADTPVITIPAWADSRSVDLDGTNDRIETPVINDTNNFDAAHSVSFWVKMDDVSTDQKWFGRYAQDGATPVRMLYGLSGSTLTIGVGTTIDTTISHGLSIGTWYLITFTYNGSTVKYYRNGTYIDQVTSVSWSNDNKSVPLYIGCLNNNGSAQNYVDGRISEVCLWSSELTAANVTSLYNSGTPIDSSTIDSANVAGHWPLEAGSGITALDYSGNGNHGLLTNSPLWSLNTPTDLPTAATDDWSVYFDGSDDEIVISDTDDLSFGDGASDSPFSVSAWIKYTGSGIQGVVVKGASGTEEWALFLSSNKLVLQLYTDISNRDNVQTTASIATDTWVHVAATYDGVNSDTNGITLYLNGEAQASSANSAGTYTYMSNKAGSAYIGSLLATYYLDGRVADAHVWSSELTATEVSELYNAGTPVDPTVNDGDYVSSGNLVGSWDMENTGTTTVTDNSANSNNGTLTNGAAFDADVPVITIPTWADNRSVLLDGTNDLISIPDDNVFSFGNGSTDGAFSVSAWIKIREVTGIYFPIFAKRDDGNTDYEWVFDITSAGHLRIILFSGNSSANQIYARSSDNHDAYEGTWIHVLATYDGGSDKSGLKVYRNGVNDTDFSFEFGTYVAMSNTSAPLLLGSFGTQFADGRMSEVCIWSSELTAANVTSLYNSGTPIDSSTIDSANVVGHWPLEAGSGKTAIDYSGNGNHGTLTNGPTWSSDTP